jgi:hypothetical protein
MLVNKKINKQQPMDPKVLKRGRKLTEKGMSLLRRRATRSLVVRYISLIIARSLAVRYISLIIAIDTFDTPVEISLLLYMVFSNMLKCFFHVDTNKYH